MAVREPTSFMRKGFWGSVVQNGPAPYVDRGPGHYSADNVDIISPGIDPQMTQMHPMAPSAYTPSAPVNYAPDFFNQRARRDGSRKKTLAQLLGYSADDPMMQKFFADMELDPSDWNMPGDIMMNRMDYRQPSSGYIPGSSTPTTGSVYEDASMGSSVSSSVQQGFGGINLNRPPPPPPPPTSITQAPDLPPGVVRGPTTSSSEIQRIRTSLKPTKTQNAIPVEDAPLKNEIIGAAGKPIKITNKKNYNNVNYEAERR